MDEYLHRWGTAFPLLGPFLGSCYLVLAGVILYSAWKNRQQGWAVGMLFGFILMSMPLWVMAFFYFAQWLGCFSSRE